MINRYSVLIWRGPWLMLRTNLDGGTPGVLLIDEKSFTASTAANATQERHMELSAGLFCR